MRTIPATDSTGDAGRLFITSQAATTTKRAGTTG
jgi:hypothetical protein